MRLYYSITEPPATETMVENVTEKRSNGVHGSEIISSIRADIINSYDTGVHSEHHLLGLIESVNAALENCPIGSEDASERQHYRLLLQAVTIFTIRAKQLQFICPDRYDGLHHARTPFAYYTWYF